MKLEASFYLCPDVVFLGKALLGKFLFSRIGGILTGGKIVETESYAGPTDRACHAFGFRKTRRNEVMYQKGGVAYVYLCYGIHHLLNVVTHEKGHPYAVLIRAIEPTHGIDIMLARRKKAKLNYSLTAGPGALSQALGITRHQNGISLTEDLLWIETAEAISELAIIKSPRVGVSYAGEDAFLPYRFRLKGSLWTSPAV